MESRGKAGEQQFMNELAELRRRNAELEALNARWKQTEITLQLERDKAQKYLDIAGVMLVAIDADHKINLINKKGCEVLGYDEEELIGKDWFDKLIPEQVREDIKRIFEDLIAGKIDPIEHYENPVLTKSGEERLIAWHNTFLTDEAGRVISTLSSGEDITERRRTQEALRKSEEMYRNLYQTMAQGVVYQNAEGKITSANPAAEKILGLTLDQMQGRTSADQSWRAIHEDGSDFPGETHPAMVALRTGKKVNGVIMGIYNPEQREVRWILVDAVPKFMPGENKPYEVYTTFDDITERKRMEEEILKIEKLESIGVLAGGIAHDLNNLLTGVMGNISLAMMYDNPADKDRRLVEAEKASMRIRDLTQQLLTFSRGGAPLLQTADMMDLLRDSATFALRGSNVRCEFRIPNDLWPVEIDEAQINQVISNIVINADQAMPGGGVIKICAENLTLEEESSLPLPEEAYVEVSISDQGVGIPEKYIQKIFDPFFTTKQKGKGLGLAASYSIIQKHHGHITVESKLGVGSTFHIYLPVSPRRFLEGGEAEDEAIKGTGRILVMDDDDIIREIASDMIVDLGYEVNTATNSAEAIELYSNAMESGRPFDIIILDLTMPGETGGEEVIQKLMEIDPDIKAIVSSGYSKNPIMANFGKYGFKGVIAKPYQTKKLSKILHEVMIGNSET